MKDNQVKKTPSIMKDCVKEFFDYGVGDPTREENHRIVRWLVLELARLENENEDVLAQMMAWAQKTYPNISPNKLSSVKKHVLWTLKNPFELGCPPKNKIKPSQSVLADCCFREEQGCKYYEEFSRLRRNLLSIEVEESLYSKYGWEEYLRDHSKSYGIYADVIYKMLRELEREREIQAGGMVTVGCNALANKINLRRNGPLVHDMTVWISTKVLEQVGLITIPVKGKRRGKNAKSRPMANGYCRVIPIPKPDK
jgi:hypothetical protein